MPYTLGMGQILVEPGQPGRNLERAAAMVREAARQGCRVVVLPECLDVGWTEPAARQLAQPIPGPHSDCLAAVARECGVYIAAGLTERAAERIFNAAVLLSPDGAVLLHHRKINELDIAHDLYSRGDRLGVAHTPLGTFGLDICADNFPDSLELAGALARMGAQVLLSPCAWAVDGDHDNARDPYGALWKGSYGTLARQHALTVIGVSNVGWITGGPWRGRKCIGCSLAVAAGGEVLAEGPYGACAEALLTVALP